MTKRTKPMSAEQEFDLVVQAIVEAFAEEGIEVEQVFSLRNDPPKPPKAVYENNPTRQRVLFAGTDSCLPSQLDLFTTDGEPDEPRRHDQDPSAGR